MKNLIIIGTGQTAIHLYEFIQYHKLFNVLGFSVDSKYYSKKLFLNLPVFPLKKLENYIEKENDYIFVALLWNKLNLDRRLLFERLLNEGYKFANIFSPKSIIKTNNIGVNCWIHDHVIVQNNTNIGSNNMIMAQSLIGAHVTLNSHCFLGAQCLIGGNCSIGEQSFIGIKATIFDDRNIGKKCIVGAGTSVNRSLPDYSVIKISSESNIIKQYTSEEIESKLIFSKNRK